MKIKQLSISSFRGIPRKLCLDFTNSRGQCISTIIYGDNGSGKSSIFDALEFNLQGMIEHSNAIGNPTRPHVLSYNRESFWDNLPEVEVEFEDETINRRTIDKQTRLDKKTGEESYSLVCSSLEPHEKFKICTFVLRRNDLYRFLSVPDAEKQILLWKNFFIAGKSDFVLKGDTEDVIRQNEYIQLKNRRRELIAELAKEVNIDASIIPVGLDEFNKFVAMSSNFYHPRQFYHNSKKNSEIIPTKFRRSNELIGEIREVSKQILAHNAIIQTKKKNEARPKINIEPYLKKASEYLCSAFKSITNADFVDSIEIRLGRSSAVSLEVFVRLKNGRKVQPQNIFSEANNDLLILLLYISILRVSIDIGQEKVVILDDILQSVDSVIRTKFMYYLLSEMPDCQFFISVHDRLWLNQLRVMFNNRGIQFKEYEILRWDFNDGPVLSSKSHPKYDCSLEEAISTDNTLIMASVAGVFLERVCNKLSISLGISIHRKPDDKYTLGELWPGLFKILKKSSLKTVCENINQLLFIRNFIGCHYNEWSISLSDQEIKSFAANVLDLYKGTFCKECNSWITKSGNENVCDCRKIVI